MSDLARSRGDVAPAWRFDALLRQARDNVGLRALRNPVRLLVGAGTCGQAVGALRVAEALREAVSARHLNVSVIEVGCTGMCFDAVQVTLQRTDRPDITWGSVQSHDAPALVDAAIGDDNPAARPHAFVWSPEPSEGALTIEDAPFLKGQRRILLESCGRSDPVDIDEAFVRGAYRGLAESLARSPEAITDAVRESRLAGMGGAHFPTWRKWQTCQSQEGPRLLVVNAEEGEPGVFKDRHLIEGDPHRLVEGLLIGAYALGAARVFVYVNGQARLARNRLEVALDQAAARGLIGENILGSGFTCRAEIREGAGGYVLGEESVLLESIEGHKPMPRVRPPHTAEAGLWSQPTVINNVETLAHLPGIIERGAEWFTSLGTQRGSGTKLISVSGDVVRPGLVEVDIGTTIREVLVGMAGGVPVGRSLQAILMGGPSGELMPPDRLDVRLEPRTPDVLLGSGNLIALDDTRSLLEVVRRLTVFNAAESCGKCTPCREGVGRMAEILDRAKIGDTRPTDRLDLLELSDVAAAASLCGLGRMAPNPVLTGLRDFSLPGLDASPGASTE